MLNTKDFFYKLPDDKIAQIPLKERDQSKLMVINRENNNIEHKIFSNIIEYLEKDDLLVLNNSKVIPARIFGNKMKTGGKIELLLLKDIGDNCWEVLVKPGRNAKVGNRLKFSDRLFGDIIDILDKDGIRIIKFYYDGIFEEILDEIGVMPLPPYITEPLNENDRYQTVYAENQGSSAAPTAGLHFTENLLNTIKNKGVNVAEITLHVGLGTFRPVKVENVSEHKMHKEYFSISQETANLINTTKRKGNKIIAVGTTSVRTLESAAQHLGSEIKEYSGETDIFIYPGYEFKIVDSIITNFHLPESTLIMLIAAFYNREKILEAYEIAVENDYRFFSFGDAMLLK
jgi:S-adenosylmethionine:tRNA ribosyltransferase-isomerase